jgi:hypothetical protein
LLAHVIELVLSNGGLGREGRGVDESIVESG